MTHLFRPPSGGGTAARRALALPAHHTNYGTDAVDEEFARWSLAADERAELWRLNVSSKDTTESFTNLSVRVVDASDGTVLGETTDLLVAEGDTPLGTSTSGADVVARLTNDTAGPRNAAVSGVLVAVPVDPA